MKRKIYNTLLEWKRTSNGRSAVMLDGARRVGKSYIAEEFARNEYAAYLVVDFAKAPRKVKRYFEEYLDNLDMFFMYLCSAYRTTLVPGNSVIIFDEVQRFPRAREAIKYLVKDGRFHYIETGSLISIRKNVKNIVIPSEECHVKMFPMDFEEFAWATGNEAMLPLIERRFKDRLPLGTDTHRQIMDVFRQYLVVGGMPQVVETFVTTHDLHKVEFEKRNILSLYRADIHKFAGALKEKVASIFSEIPAQLSKHEKKFRLSALKPGAKYRDWDDAFFWLKDARVVNICYNSTEPNIGLKMNEDRTTLKCYMNDTGLLISHAFDEKGIVSSEIYQKLLFGKLEVNEGMLIENIVAQMLATNGNKLFFYSKSSEEAEERMEIDFLLQKDKVTARHNIRLIEVKSGKNYTLSSLSKCMKKFGEYMTMPTVLHAADYKVQDGITYLPLYMTPLL